MSFRRDLQAWANAEVRRRAATGQQSAIESLLYPPYQSARSHQSRSGIAPTIGTGIQNGGGIILVGTGIILEHGMMWHELPAQDVPIDIYPTGWSKAYLAGAGTGRPGIVERQYLIGELEKSQDGELHWPTNPRYWQTEPFKSQVWIDQDTWDSFWPVDGSLISTNFSGLMRLWIQCLNGSGTKPTDAFLGGAHPLRKGEDGLLRLWDATLETYQYWHIRADSSSPGSVWAGKCVLSAEGAAMLPWLNASKLGTITLTDETKRLIESWILVGMTTGSSSVVLDETAMAGVWENSARSLGYGWCYSRQAFGSATEEIATASIVTHGETLTGSPTGSSIFHAKHYHLSFSVDNGVLTPSLTLQEGPIDWSSTASLGPVWYPSNNGVEYEYLQHAANYVGDDTIPQTDVPLYCFWSDDKEEMCRFNMENTVVSDENTDDFGVISIPGGGSGSKEYWIRSSRTTGGPYVVGVSPSSHQTFSGTEKNKTFTASQIGTCRAGWSVPESFSGMESWSWKNYSGGPDISDKNFPQGCWPTGWWNQEPSCDTLRNKVNGRFTIDVGRFVETVDESFSQKWSEESPLVITMDPEAVYTVYHRAIRRTGSSTTWDYSEKTDNSTRQFGLGGLWEYDGYSGRFEYRCESRGGYWYDAQGIVEGYSFPVTKCSHIIGLPDTFDATSESITPETFEYTDSAHLVTSHGVQDISGGSWGPYFWTTPMTPIGATVDAIMSYHSGSGLYASEPSVWVMTDDLNFTPSSRVLIPLGAV